MLKAVRDFQSTDTYRRLLEKRIILTVTSGRSGTGLLATLLRAVPGVHAEHEPEPRANFVLRDNVEHPHRGLEWLAKTKLPTIAQASSDIYVETSHLHCKGFIEFFLLLGLRPEFLILRRDAQAVARSLYRMDVIPGRSVNGLMVLLHPGDPNVLPLPDWQSFSDYQLCYWYVLEIERRQAAYRGAFRSEGLSFFDLSIDDLVDWKAYKRLACYIQPSRWRSPSRDAFSAIVLRNQNPRDVAHPGQVDRELPSDLTAQEEAVDAACAPYLISAAVRLAL